MTQTWLRNKRTDTSDVTTVDPDCVVSLRQTKLLHRLTHPSNRVCISIFGKKRVHRDSVTERPSVQISNGVTHITLVVYEELRCVIRDDAFVKELRCFVNVSCILSVIRRIVKVCKCIGTKSERVRERERESKNQQNKQSKDLTTLK